MGFSTNGGPASKSRWKTLPCNAFSLQSQLEVSGELFFPPGGQIFLHPNGDRNHSHWGVSTVQIGVLVILSPAINILLGCRNDPRSSKPFLDF